MTRILSGALAALVLVATLLTASATVSPAAAGVGKATSWGSTDAKRQKLRSGCHGYTFTYRVDVPTDDWMAEVTLRNPDGEALATRDFNAFANDPRKATRRFRFCDVSTRPGRHKITMRVTSEIDREERTQRAEPTKFRLVRR